MIDNLIINENVKVITDDYSLFVNISSLEIPLSVKEIEENVFDSFLRLKYVKCDPKWLLKFLNSKIEILFVPDGIKEIKKKYFVNMIHLNFIEIPESVDLIEENAFENCNELTSFKCGTKHLNFLDKKKIKSLIFNNEVKVADKSHFDELVNFETLALPEKIEIKDHSIFSNCKKLITINNPYYEKYTTFRCIIEAGTKKIKRKMFDGWTNLKILSIPESVTEIEEDSFKDCTNLKYLSCNPKWFNLFYKFPISSIYVPDFVTKISKGQVDSFLFLSCIRLPKNIAIDDPSIFDECESLTFIDADPNLLATLSNKTKKRCNWTDKKTEYSKPIFGGEQDTVINKTLQQQGKDENDNNEAQKEENVFIEEEEEEKDINETTIDDLIEFDQNNEKYAHFIKNILQDIETLNDYEPKNTNLSEIAKICTVICHKINKSYKIIPRPVQLLVVLRLADDILNNKKSHGSISEIKTGEGKSLIITILTIILVIFKRKVDIVSSNMELVKRDQKEQKNFFDLFGIETGVFYNKNSDIDFMASIRNFFNSGGGLHIFKDFTVNVLDFPVVYSTNTNYESLYLKSIFSMNPRQREYDVVLVDEVDNMFIDEFSSPLLIANEIDYAYINDILQIVFILRSLKASEVIKFLEYFFPNIGIFELENIEMLQDAANRACNLKNKVDYIVQNGNIIIIDPNTGFKKLNSRWNNYIHEMVEIKEGLEPQKSTVSFCQITQNGYFNLYKKIAGVTGTIGSPGDEEILKKGYKVQTFKVPRHFRSKMKVIIKNRPKSIEQVFNAVCDEIIQERNKGRPVLVIWDSIKNAEDFLNKKPYIFAQQIIGIKPELDRKSIENAGIPETVTIATLAAGRGVDIKLTKESLEAGGLHVIIPMPMSSQRALDQAAGRAGRQGQPGSVTFYTSENDKFRKPIEFSKGDDNLVKLELMFSKYLRSNFPWMLQGPGLNGFNGNIFPFAASPSIVLRILARRIAFVIKRNPFSEINERFQDLALQMVQLAWGIFFSSLCDNVESCEDWDLVEDLYNDFLKELNYWFDPIKSHTADGAVWYIRGILIKEIDWEYVIVNGIKITSLCLCVVFPAAAPTIILVSGVVLSGGQEIYHQLQNGQKINWIQVLIRVGGSLVRSAIMIKFGIGSNKLDIVFYSAFRSKAPDMIIHLIETMLCQKVEREEDAADADLEWEDSLNNELSKSITLSINISATTQDTNKWIYHNVKQKKKKPKNLIKFKPRNYPAILNIEFIRMAMKLANDVYDFKANIGKIIFKCYENDLYKPVFHCIEDSKNLFVVIRGSSSKIDWGTDFCCWSTKINLNGVDVYFHSGFYNAAIYVLDKIHHILENTKKTIYLIGHSYAASVSSVMIYLLKSQKKFINRTIYTLAFAPAPAMSFCPPEISRLIFAFINRDDFVTSLSCFNALNSAVKAKFGSKRIFLKKNLTTIKAFKQNWTEMLVATAFDHFDDILREMDFPKVKCVKGTIFKIGVGKKRRLIECRIKESQLPTTLSITMTAFSDHLMIEYIKSFKRIET